MSQLDHVRREESKLVENVDLHWRVIDNSQPSLIKDMERDEGMCAFRHKRNVTSVEKNDLMCREGLFIFKRLKMMEYNTFNL
jgi:hypothetical protein